MDLRDKQLGLFLRDEAIESVTAHANEAWLEAAYDAAVALGRVVGEWTTDDVWQRLAEAGVARPHEPRAMAAVIRRLTSEGRIRPRGYRISELPICHGRPKQIWVWLR